MSCLCRAAEEGAGKSRGIVPLYNVFIGIWVFMNSISHMESRISCIRTLYGNKILSIALYVGHGQ